MKWTDSPPDLESGVWRDVVDTLLVCMIVWLLFFLAVFL